MTNPHRRRKDPDHVRAQLLDCTIALAKQKGFGAVTTEAVARAAGVTKGGLFHHFPNKQALIDAALDRLNEEFLRMIEREMESDPIPYGRFTRAYLRLSFYCGREDPGWTMVWLSIMTDPAMRILWADKLQQALLRLHRQDSAEDLAIARLAADGIWMARIGGITPFDMPRLQDRILEMAKPPRSCGTNPPAPDALDTVGSASLSPTPASLKSSGSQ